MFRRESSTPPSGRDAAWLAVEVNGAPEVAAHAETTANGVKRVEWSPALLKARRIVAALGNDPLADPYKVLGIQVRRRLHERGWRVLGVTSPGRGEGKTLTAINLSVSFAAEPDQTVLLVDTDLRRPAIASILGLEGRPGLVDHLTEEVPVDRLVMNPGLGRLAVLPAGRASLESAELLGSSKMARLLADEARRNPARLVIVDMPPVLDGADALAFAPSVDAVLLVIDASRTRTDHVERALQLLQGTPVLGTVLNKA
jgi:capsular exopolysaccharide synthesis family protein